MAAQHSSCRPFARSARRSAFENLQHIVLTFLGIPWIALLIMVDVGISVMTLLRIPFETIMLLLYPPTRPAFKIVTHTHTNDADVHPSKLLIVGADRACRGFLAEIEPLGAPNQRHEALGLPVGPLPLAAATTTTYTPPHTTCPRPLTHGRMHTHKFVRPCTCANARAPGPARQPARPQDHILCASAHLLADTCWRLRLAVLDGQDSCRCLSNRLP